MGETAFGGGGDDLIRNTSGGDLLDGGDGVDRVSYFNIAAAITVDLMLQGAAQDTGGGGFDTLVSIENISGTAFNDTIRGDDNANQINANAGDDIVEGRGGDDVLIGDGDAIGNDTLDGGSGVDTVSYSPNLFETARTEGVFVNLLAGFAGSISGGETDTLISIENVEGTDFDDTILGDDGDNTLSGLGGNDFIQGRGGNDTLRGGEGDDHLAGESTASSYNGPFGNDLLFGEGGDDLLRGGAGVDSFDGGDGQDRVSFFTRAATQGAIANLATQTIANDGFGNAETMVSIENLGAGTAFADHFTGDDNDNFLFGEMGDTLLGAGGNDSFQLGGGPALVDGGAGIDTITGFFGDFGSLFPDSNGDGLAEIVFATSGVTVNLRTGQILSDGFGFTGTLVSIENLNGSALADTLTGDNGANVLGGLDGDDAIDGGRGDDQISGDAGNDVLSGGRGVDRLGGGAGDDTLDGGAQDDIFVFAPGGGLDTVLDFDARPGGGQDLLDISAYSITAADFAARVVVADLGAHTQVTIDGADVITLLGVNGNGQNVVTVNDFILAS